MPTRFPAWLLATTLAGAAPLHALGATHASVHLSHFGYSLFDLNLSDGIAPTLTVFSFPGTSTVVEATVNEQPLDAAGQPLPRVDVDREYVRLPAAIPTAGRAHAALPDTSGTARLHGSMENHSFSAMARGHGAPPGAQFFTFEAITHAFADVGVLALSPFTRLVWSGQLHLSARVALDPDSGRIEGSNAAFYWSLQDLSSGLNLDDFSHGVSVRGSSPDAQRLDLPLHIEWVNDSAQEATAWPQLTVLVAGYTLSPRSPIPEPGTWALLACGLGVVGAAAGRRRPRAPGGPLPAPA